MYIDIGPTGQVKVGTADPSEAPRIMVVIERLKKLGIKVVFVGPVESHKHDQDRVLRSTGIRNE